MTDIKKSKIEKIRETVSMLDVIEFHGIGDISKNKILCPFHDEKTKSFSFKENLWKCFGCGKGGDVIRFYEYYFELDFNQAISKIDNDFNLNLFKDTHISLKEYREIEKRQLENDNKKLERYRTKVKLTQNYEDCLKKWRLNQDTLKKHKPKKIEELSDEFTCAIKETVHIEYELEKAFDNLNMVI